MWRDALASFAAQKAECVLVVASLIGCEGSGVLEGMLVVARCHGVPQGV